LDSGASKPPAGRHRAATPPVPRLGGGD